MNEISDFLPDGDDYTVVFVDAETGEVLKTGKATLEGLTVTHDLGEWEADRDRQVRGELRDSNGVTLIDWLPIQACKDQEVTLPSSFDVTLTRP